MEFTTGNVIAETLACISLYCSHGRLVREMNEHHALLQVKSIECSQCKCVIGPEDKRFKMGTGGFIKCFSCAAFDSALIKRAAVMSMIVGTILTLINQGTLLFAGQLRSAMIWQIPLTYATPFVVSWTSVMNSSMLRQ